MGGIPPLEPRASAKNPDVHAYMDVSGNLTEDVKKRVGHAMSEDAGGLDEKELATIEMACEAGFRPAFRRVTVVRHAKTVGESGGPSSDASPMTDIDPREIPRAAKLGRRMRESGYGAHVERISTGMERRSAETAAILARELGGVTVDETALLNSRDRSAEFYAEGEHGAIGNSLAYAKGAVAAGEKISMGVIHRANVRGINRTLALDKHGAPDDRGNSLEPLGLREYDLPELAIQGVNPGDARISIDHDAEGTIRVGADNFPKIRFALRHRHAGLANAAKHVRNGKLSILDFQNLLNATLINDPALAKSLAGRGVEELDLMALRAAMGVGPFVKYIEPDYPVAAKSVTSLLAAGPDIFARTGMTLAEMGERGLLGKLVTTMIPEWRETRKIGKTKIEEIFQEAANIATGKARGGLESFANRIAAAFGADNAFMKSLDPRISGTRGNRTATWPLGGNYRPKFRLLGPDGVAIFDSTTPEPGHQAELLTTLAGDTPGITVIEASGGSGKSLILAEAIRMWLISKNDKPDRVAYVDLADQAVEKDGSVREIETAAKTSDILMVDSLDEARWADADMETELGAKQKAFAEKLQNLADQGKKIVLCSRQSYWAGGGRRLRLPPFDEKRADDFVTNFLVSTADGNLRTALQTDWKHLCDSTAKGPSLTEVVGNPLTLLLLCKAVCENIDLEKTKNFSWYAKNVGHLFEDATRARLVRWETRKNRTPLSAADRQALKMQEKKNGEVRDERIEDLMNGLGQLAFLMEMNYKITNKNVAAFLPASCLTHLDYLDKDGATIIDIEPLGFLMQDARQGEVMFVSERVREFFEIRHLRRLCANMIVKRHDVVHANCGRDPFRIKIFQTENLGKTGDLRDWLALQDENVGTLLIGGDRKQPPERDRKQQLRSNISPFWIRLAELVLGPERMRPTWLVRAIEGADQIAQEEKEKEKEAAAKFLKKISRIGYGNRAMQCAKGLGIQGKDLAFIMESAASHGYADLAIELADRWKLGKGDSYYIINGVAGAGEVEKALQFAKRKGFGPSDHELYTAICCQIDTWHDTEKAYRALRAFYGEAEAQFRWLYIDSICKFDNTNWAFDEVLEHLSDVPDWCLAKVLVAGLSKNRDQEVIAIIRSRLRSAYLARVLLAIFQKGYHAECYLVTEQAIQSGRFQDIEQESPEFGYSRLPRFTDLLLRYARCGDLDKTLELYALARSYGLVGEWLRQCIMWASEGTSGTTIARPPSAQELVYNMAHNDIDYVFITPSEFALIDPCESIENALSNGTKDDDLIKIIYMAAHSVLLKNALAIVEPPPHGSAADILEECLGLLARFGQFESGKIDTLRRAAMGAKVRPVHPLYCYSRPVPGYSNKYFSGFFNWILPEENGKD